MKNIFAFLPAMLLFCCPAFGQIITTVAGDSTAGYNADGIPAITSELDHPIGIAVDSAGNFYIADTHNNRIRKVNTTGIITTIAGTGVAGFSGDGGPATDAEIHYPYGVAVDAAGNVYFADEVNSRVRKINTSGILTTVAGTDTVGYNGDGIFATSAELNVPGGVAVDGNGNIYIADGYNNRIRKINDSGIITTYAGNGTAGYGYNNVPATSAGIFWPYGIAIDNIGNLYIACQNGADIYKVNTLGNLNIIAGNGTNGYTGDGGAATAAQLNVIAVAADNIGNIYIVDPDRSVLRMVNSAGIISTIAGIGVGWYNGDNQPATDAALFDPTGVAVNAKGSIYIADFDNNRIRFIQNTAFVNTIKKPPLDMAFFPIPFQGNFHATVTAGSNEPLIISIANSSGEKIKEINTYTNQTTEIKLNAPPGIYILSGLCADGTCAGRILIK